MPNDEKEYCSWEMFDEGCRTIAKAVEVLQEERNKEFGSIYGIPRGGVVVAVRLSHLLDIPYWNAFASFTLIVDDIADTGKTLEYWKVHGFTIATLYYHRQSIVVPNVWVYEKTNGRWVVFPWEVV